MPDDFFGINTSSPNTFANSFKLLIEKRTNELQYCFSRLKLPDELLNLKKIV